MSPLLFNFYANDLSEQLQKLPVGCCCGDMVVNHLMYADDIVLLAPSGKGMQTIIDATYAYGNAYDIVFNITKSQVMFCDTLKIGQAANIMLGDTVLSVTQTYRYLGHIITNNLSDEADMEDKMRGLYARSNMLRRKFYFCSDQVKNKLFSAYCNNIYICVRYGSPIVRDACASLLYHLIIIRFVSCVVCRWGAVQVPCLHPLMSIVVRQESDDLYIVCVVDLMSPLIWLHIV